MRPSDNRSIALRQPILAILLALGDDSMHGYAIMQALEEKTDGRERVLPGTLYAAISRMVAEGLIEERNPPKNEVSAGPTRRYYRRTARGRAAARDEAARLRALLRMAVAQDLVPGISK
ncbi:MAG TPA: PadR family transcriptional regulator [Gemmatimonadaceae bacterium]